MLRFLRLPCALLALLLSALGGTRLAAIERHDDDRAKTPVVSPAHPVAALPDVPMPISGPTPALPVMIAGLAAEPLAVLTIPDGPSLPAPSQRRGSAGGARAP